MERRITSAGPHCRVEDRAEGGQRAVGYAAVYYCFEDPGTQYQLGEGIVERIAPGAFADVLGNGDDVRGLFNHEPDHLLGRLSAGTLRLVSDDVGLRYEIDLPDTQAGRDVAISIKRGDLTGSSFGFKMAPGGARWDKDGAFDVRTLARVGKLYDVGPVTYPAYGATSTALRSADDGDEALKEFEQLQKLSQMRKRFGVSAHARALDVAGKLG